MNRKTLNLDVDNQVGKFLRDIQWSFDYSDYGTKCDTVNDTQYEQKCETQYRTEYETQYEEKCETRYEQKCETKYETQYETQQCLTSF